LMKFGQYFDMKKGAEAAAAMESGAAAPEAASSEPLPEGLNPKAVGRIYKGKAQFLHPEKLTAYAAATDNPNPAYQGEDAIAPVMFSVNPVMDAIAQCVADPQVNADLLRLVHGEQDMYFYNHLKPWDLVYPVAYFDAIEEKSSGQLMRVRQQLLVDGDPAVEILSGYFIRGNKKKEAGEAKPKAPAPAAPAADERVFCFETSQTVTADQPIRYGHASGDTNPIHMDNETAKAAGHPGIILHGLCTMAFACKAIVDEHLGGDPTRLQRLKARFSRVVLPGDVITTRGWIVDQVNGKTILGYEATNQDGKPVITNGLVEYSS